MLHCKHRNLRLVGAESLGEADEGKVKLSVSKGGGYGWDLMKDFEITGTRKHLKSFFSLFLAKIKFGVCMWYGDSERLFPQYSSNW